MWLTVADAVEYSQICRSTLFKLRRQGRLRMVGTERKRLINREHLDEQIEKGFPPLGPAAVPKRRKPPIKKLVW
jgi:excisionase family DNA binding protein